MARERRTASVSPGPTRPQGARAQCPKSVSTQTPRSRASTTFRCCSGKGGGGGGDGLGTPRIAGGEGERLAALAV
eukprot:12689636-Alexandrium_andersonii.AAC.1